MMLKDGSIVELEGWQRDLILAARAADAADAARAFGLNDALALHRPGPRRCTDGYDVREEVYQDEKRKLQDAWRRPISDASGGGRDPQPGDQCMIDGQPGHLNHRLECVPDREDAMSAMDARERAYQDSKRELQDAWRGPVGGAAPQRRVPRTMTMDEAQKIKDEAWLEMCRDLESAWRKPLP
jgi:hypothetical protein